MAYSVPTPRAISQAFKVPYNVAHAAWRALRTATHGRVDPLRALEAAWGMFVKWDAAQFGSWPVRPLDFSPSGGQWSGDNVTIGYYVDPGDTYDTTLVWLNDEVYKEWNGAAKAYVWNTAGFVLSSWGSELEAWEQWTRENETEEDIENRGPNADDGCDLWTDDARYFFVFREGRHGHDQHRGRSDKSAGHIDVPTPPDAAAGKIEQREEWLGTEEAEADEALRLRVEAEIEALRTELNGYDDPWDGSYDAQQECDRLGVWWHIQKFQEELGCYGNVWFRRGYGRSYDWKLLKQPPNYAYWTRSQDWRKTYRTRAAAVKAQVQIVGAAPAPGDLYTDHLFAKTNWGITIYRVGGGGLPFAQVSRADIQAGRGWPLIWRAVATQSQRLGRPARFWSAQPNTDPLSWALVTPGKERPLSGLGGLPRGRSRRVRRKP